MGVLTDITVSRETVDIWGKGVEVRGITLSALAQALARFPELAKLFDKRAFDYEQLLKEAPRVAGAAMAAGVGCLGDEAEEQAALALPLEAQLDLLAAIFRLTFKAGVGPFAEKLGNLMSSAAIRDGPTTTLKPSPTSQPEAASAEPTS
jgi:hypothetical protein